MKELHIISDKNYIDLSNENLTDTVKNNDNKITFGFTNKNIDVIVKYIKRFEGAEFDRDTWIKIGKEIGWEPLAASLWYFRKLSKDTKNNIVVLPKKYV